MGEKMKPSSRCSWQRQRDHVSKPAARDFCLVLGRRPSDRSRVIAEDDKCLLRKRRRSIVFSSPWPPFPPGYPRVKRLSATTCRELFSLVHHTHATTAYLLDDAVVRDDLTRIIKDHAASKRSLKTLTLIATMLVAGTRT
jgi:hypothetical protein